MKNFSCILKSNYIASNNWKPLKYDEKKWLVIDRKLEVFIASFSNFKNAQKLARHLNKTKDKN